MKLQLRWTAVMYFALTLMLLTPTPSWAVEDAIIAVVNDELITLKDLKDYAQSKYISLIAEGLSDAQVEQVMKDMEVSGINRLIEDKLVLSKANIIGIDVREGAIDERVEELKKKYGSEQSLINALVKSGATITDLRNKIRDQMKTQFVVDHEVRSRIYVNPQEVTKYYEDNKGRFAKKERINLASIFISYDTGKKAALAEAVIAFKNVVTEIDFDDLIEIYSDSPSVGTIERGQLLPVIEEAIFNLNVNEISHLIEVDNGIYIFKLIGKTPSQIPELEEIKEEISNQLFKEKFRSELLHWTEDLKKDAYIEIKK